MHSVNATFHLFPIHVLYSFAMSIMILTRVYAISPNKKMLVRHSTWIRYFKPNARVSQQYS